MHEDAAPFADHIAFEFAELLYKKMGASEGDVDQLLNLIHARDIVNGHEDSPPIFTSYKHMTGTVDDSMYGGGGWTTHAFSWAGPVDDNSP